MPSCTAHMAPCLLCVVFFFSSFHLLSMLSSTLSILTPFSPLIRATPNRTSKTLCGLYLDSYRAREVICQELIFAAAKLQPIDVV